MKKIASIIMVIATIFTLTACGGNECNYTINADGSGSATNTVWVEKGLAEASGANVENWLKGDWTETTIDGKVYKTVTHSKNWDEADKLDSYFLNYAWGDASYGYSESYDPGFGKVSLERQTDGKLTLKIDTIPEDTGIPFTEEEKAMMRDQIRAINHNWGLTDAECDAIIAAADATTDEQAYLYDRIREAYNNWNLTDAECDKIIANSTQRITFNMPGMVVQNSGFKNGVTIQGTTLTMDFAEINKNIPAIYTFTISPGVQSVVDPLDSFADVSANAYYIDAVRWAIRNRITNGTSSTTFSPNATCTTAQILTFLWRASGQSEPTIQNPFNDVSNSDYFFKPALWAYENGLVSGNVFNGGTACTRAMTVTYLWKLAGSPAATPSTFADVDSGSDYATAVAWAVVQGITSGTSETAFSPDRICTRGQIVTFLYRNFADK